MASPEHTNLVAKLREASASRGGSFAEQREMMERAVAKVPLPERVRSEAAIGPGFAGEWFRTGTPSAACVLYLHGGGFVFGSSRSHRPLIGHLAHASGLDVLAVNYRLAPEHPYPAALDDTLAAYRYLLAQGTPASRIGPAGDSAGGGLALSALMAMRAKGLPMAACGVLMCPWLDLTLTAPSVRRNAAADPLASVVKGQAAGYAAAYIGEMSVTDPAVSPAFGDFTGLPPLLVQTGTADSLEDDAHLCVRRAQEAGVTATLDLWLDMIHVWQAHPHILPEAGAAITKAASFLTSRLG